MTEVASSLIGKIGDECLDRRSGMAERRCWELRRIAGLMLIGALPFFPAKGQNLYFYVANPPSPGASVTLHMRPSPNSAQQISELPKGTRLRVLELSPGGWWKVQVSPSGPEGWVRNNDGDQLRVQCCILQDHD